jgi:hypothetical protein
MTTRRFYQRVNRHAIHGPECSETEHQEALISWARDTEALQTDDALKREALHFLHHVPSGGGRGKPLMMRGTRLPPVEAFRMKMAGVVPGISDLRLDYVRHTRNGEYAPDHECHFPISGPYYGLVAEMKAAKGILTPDQRRYHEFMTAQRFVCKVWRTWQRGAIDITAYMGLEVIAPVWVMIESNAVTRIDSPLELLKLEVAL